METLLRSHAQGTTLSIFEFNRLLVRESFGVLVWDSGHRGNASPVSFRYGTTLSTLALNLLLNLLLLGFWCWIEDTVETFLRSHSLTGQLCRPLKPIFCPTFWDLGFGLRTLWNTFAH